MTKPKALCLTVKRGTGLTLEFEGKPFGAVMFPKDAKNTLNQMRIVVFAPEYIRILRKEADEIKKDMGQTETIEKTQ